MSEDKSNIYASLIFESAQSWKRNSFSAAVRFAFPVSKYPLTKQSFYLLFWPYRKNYNCSEVIENAAACLYYVVKNTKSAPKYKEISFSDDFLHKFFIAGHRGLSVQ